MPDWMETPALLGGPVIIVLFALPFFKGTGEKSWRRRPVAVITWKLVVNRKGGW